MSKRTTEAQAEIAEFLNSGQPGMITTFSKDQVWRAAESLFTAKGLDCPVEIKSTSQGTLLINRKLYNGNSTNTNGNH